MNQAVARVMGVVFIVIGVIGFFSGGMHMSPGLELGVFPVNVLHNVLHILVGLWGLSAARTPRTATTFCKQAGMLYLLLAIIGFIPSLAVLLEGLLPLGGNDIWLHLAFGVMLLYSGVRGPRPAGASV